MCRWVFRIYVYRRVYPPGSSTWFAGKSHRNSSMMFPRNGSTAMVLGISKPCFIRPEGNHSNMEASIRVVQGEELANGGWTPRGHNHCDAIWLNSTNSLTRKSLKQGPLWGWIPLKITTIYSHNSSRVAVRWGHSKSYKRIQMQW